MTRVYLPRAARRQTKHIRSGISFSLSKLATICLSLGICASASAVRFPIYPTSTLTSTQNTTWTLDRLAPRVWTNEGNVFGRIDVLRIGVDALDGPLVRPAPFNTAFYNIQGRQIGFPSLQGAGATLAGSMYVPTSWNTANAGDTTLNRRTDLYIQLTPLASDDGACTGGAECLYFGGLGFSNAQIADPLAGGGPPRIRILKKGVGDGWINLPDPYRLDNWNDVCITFTGNALEYRLNNQLVFTDSTLTPTSTLDGPPNRMRVAVVSDYNFGTTFDARWSDLEYGARASLTMVRASTASVTVGGNVSFQTTVTNNGTTPANAVQVLEPAVAGLAFVSATGACTTLPCTIGTLAAGASATYTSTYSVTAVVGSVINNRAYLKSDSVDCDKSDNARTTALTVAPVGSTVQAPSLNTLGLLALILSMTGVVAWNTRKQLG